MAATKEEKRSRKGKNDKEEKPGNSIVDETIRLMEYEEEDRVVSAKEVFDREAKGGPVVPMALSTFKKMDAIIEGYYEGQLITISGPPGHGKTCWARTMTKVFVPQGVGCLWFSYEEPPNKFLRKFPEDLLPLFYMPNKLAETKPDWIEERIKEAKVKFGACCVFVDNLSYITDVFQMHQPSLEIGAIVRKLKRIAVHEKIIFFLIAHMPKLEAEREPRAGDIRDSSLIEAESDIVMYIWRDKGEENLSIAKVTKSRETGIINVKVPLGYDPVGKLYYEYNDVKGRFS
jgi:KaiC/GvpD/RAD55 family RecA-like ATPase